MIVNLLHLFKKKARTGLPTEVVRSEMPAPVLRREQLVPRIRHVNFLKALRAHGVPEEHLPATTPLCGELLVSYAFDLPEQFVMATPAQLEQVAIAPSEVPALALHNLARLVPQPRQLRQQGCIVVYTGADLEATVLLLDAFWQEMQASLGAADIVVAAPRRNRLLLCDGSDARALEQLGKLARTFHTEVQDVHALSLQQMVRRDGRWQLFAAH